MFLILVLYNPVQNGDFEQWSYISTTIPFAWDTIKGSGASCTWTPDTAAFIGNRSIRITSAVDVSGFDCGIAQAKVVSENTDYLLKTWVINGDTTNYARIYVRCYDSDGNFLSSSFVGIPSSSSISGWQQISGIYTTPAGCYYLDMQVRVYGTGSIVLDASSMYISSTFVPDELVESFITYVPDGWLEEDPGITSDGLLRKRTSACPVDGDCFGTKYRQGPSDGDLDVTGLAFLLTDTMDFVTPTPETLFFYWRTSDLTPPNPEDSINVEISIDGGNSWTRIWQWDGTPSTVAVAETVALDMYNDQSQVMLRFAFYKNSTTPAATNKYFNVDSVRVVHSYVGRYNRLTNPGFELWLYDTLDMMADYWERRNNRAPYSNIAQLWIMRDSENVFSGNYSLKAFFTTTQNPFVEQTLANPFTDGCAGQLVSDIDSYSVHITTRLYDDDPNGKARIGVVWYSGASAIQTTYTPNYTVNSTVWQLFELYDTLSTGPAQGTPVDSINFRIRFYNEGTFPDAENGATVYADSVNLTWYCFVDDVTPVDVAEMYPMNPVVEFIRHYGNRLQVALRKPAVVEIYDVRGRLVSRREVKDRMWFQPGRGVFIVRIGDFRKKVVLY